VCSETERITNQVMNRHDYDRLAQRLGPAHSAELEGRYDKGSEASCGEELSRENPETTRKPPDDLATLS
jgi:hypothetical protein